VNPAPNTWVMTRSRNAVAMRFIVVDHQVLTRGVFRARSSSADR